MSAMFSNSRANQSSNSGHLVEFKAGRSMLHPGSDSKKSKVVAEKTKGLVYIKVSSDQLVHFCWKNRETGAVVDDLIIFPGDTEFKEVKGCPDGKVYMLKFKTSDDRRLFWIQDGNADADKDICTKVNEALNKPPPARAPARGGSSERTATAQAAAALGLNGADLTDEMNPLGSLNQQQLMNLLQFMHQGGNSDSAPLLPPASGTGSGSASSAAAQASSAASSTPASSRNPVSAAQLQSLLSGINPNRHQNPSVDLSDAMTAENILDTVLSNEARLGPLVPSAEAGTSQQEELRETVRAPQFRQVRFRLDDDTDPPSAADSFGHALQTGQMGPVLQQFGLPSEVTRAAANGDIVEFAQRLTEAEGGAAAPVEEISVDEDDVVKEPEPKRGKQDDQDEMDLD